MKSDASHTLADWAPWAVILLIYLLTSSPYLVGGDNAEFILLGAQGGRAHPPGYPLYILYLQALSWLPALNAAHAASMATALIGAAACAVVFRGARAWGATPIASLLATLGLALSPQWWFVSTHAEVFALNHLMAALMVWVAAERGPLRAGPRMLALGLIAGLGLANHHTIVLLAPVGFYGVYLGFREASRPLLWLVGSGLTLLIGLTPYLQLLAASAHPDHFQWGDISDFAGITYHFLRGDYGTTTLAPYAEGPRPLTHLLVFGRELASDLAFIGAFLGLVGLANAFGWRWIKPANLGRLSTDSKAVEPISFENNRSIESESTAAASEKLSLSDPSHRDLLPPASRAAMRCLAASFALAGPLFVLLFNLDTHDIALEVIRRFYTLPELLLTIFIALGIDATRPLWARQSKVVRALIVSLFFGLLVGTSLLRLSANYQPTIDDYVQNLLGSLPQDAILLSSGDARFLGIEYYRRVEKLRPDIAFIHPSLLRFDWYAKSVRGELARKHEIHADILPQISKEDLAHELLRTGRSVFWAESAEDQPDGFVIYPQGLASRVLAPEAAYPSGDKLMRDNLKIMADYQVHEPPNYNLNPWGWRLYHEQARAWQDVAALCERAGDAACQQAALEEADALP